MAENAATNQRSPEDLFSEHRAKARAYACLVAAKLPPHIQSQSTEDLCSIAEIALWDVAKSFNPHNGCSFWSYAFARVRGSILDELRQMDPLPRNQRTLLKKVLVTKATLEQECGHEVSFDEACADHGLDPDETQTLLTAYSFSTVSLDEPVGDSGDSDSPMRGEAVPDDRVEHPICPLEREEWRLYAAKLVAALPGTKGMVLRLVLYSGVRFQDLGDMTGLTESRVCQMVGEAVLDLRRRSATFLG